MACCIIHNFIRKVARNDELFGLYEHEGSQADGDRGDQQVRSQTNLRDDERAAGEQIRASIAQQLWSNHQRRTTQLSQDD